MKKDLFSIGFMHGHNSSASLMINDRIIAAISEERFTRKKNSTDFPINSINYLIKEYGLNKKKIKFTHPSFIIPFSDQSEIKKYNNFVEKKSSILKKLKDELIFNFLFRSNKLREIIKFLYHKKNTKKNNETYIKNQKKIISKKIAINENQIELVDHHMMHVYTAAHGFIDRKDLNKEYLVMSLDGEGDGLCATIYKFSKGNLKLLSSTIAGNSLAGFYGAITKFLGMKINEHEYKVMGIAAYHQSSKYINNIIRKFEELFYINKNLQFVSRGGLNYFLWFLNKHFSNERFDNISAAAQIMVERKAIEWVVKAIKKYKISNICLTGGFFMNIKVNKLINELPEVKKLVVCPSSGDESVPIGAAYYGNEKFNLRFKDTKKINNLYLGKKIDTENLNKVIKKFKLKKKVFKSYKDLNKYCAKLLKKDEIIARVCGRMEFGARALGNRSVLANPSNINSLHNINKKIKKRDFWMPFACSVLDKFQNLYLKDYKQTGLEYMSISCGTTELGQKKLISAIHPFDKSARPQIVKKTENEEYYDLINSYYKITGTGALLNTSFNIHGEPVVMTVDDALKSFVNCGLNYIIIENNLITKI